MAVALPYVAVALAGASAVKQYKAGKDAERAAQANAAAERAQAAEEARRLKREQRQRESTARARAAASGVRTSSRSTDMVMGEMKAEHARELDWLKKSGASRVKQAEMEGSLASKQATASAFGTLSSAATSAYSGFGG